MTDPLRHDKLDGAASDLPLAVDPPQGATTNPPAPAAGSQREASDAESHDKADGVVSERQAAANFQEEASNREKLLASVGLGFFGFAVGIVAVLSEQSGTAITLLGLLFALLGGSLISLFANANLSERMRCHIGIAVGLISIGLFLGMAVAFTAKAFGPPINKQVLPPKSPESSDAPGGSLFVIHGAVQREKAKKLADASKSVIANLGAEDPNRGNFEDLLRFLEYLQTVDSKLDTLADLAKKEEQKYGKDGFESKLREFRKEMKSSK